MTLEKRERILKKHKIFICYSHEDEALKEKVCNHLKVYKQDLDIWDDRRIIIGTNWEEEIRNSINDCDAAVMLISNSFLLSEFITKIEIPELLQRRENDNIPIWLFILRHCDWNNMFQLGRIQAYPKDARAYVSFGGHKKEETIMNFSKEVFSQLRGKEPSISLDDSNLEIVDNSISLNRDLTLLAQLDQFFSLKFEGIKVLPSEYYLEEYPFKNGFKNGTSRRNFALTLNKELSELFETFRINKAGVLQNTFSNLSEYNCAFRVLTVLNQNCINYVRIGNKRELKKIIIRGEEENFSQLDHFERFEIKHALEKLPKINEDDNLELKIKKGYFYYVIGEYFVATEHFTKALEKAENEKNYIKIYICNHNLYHLGRLIDFNFWNLPKKEEIVKNLRDIDLNYLLKTIPINESEKKIWKNDGFFKEADSIIKRESTKIVDKYYSFLNGGRSSDNYNYEIFYQYAVLRSFLSLNLVVYDDYYEYKELLHGFIESVFASYSIKNSSAKITKIDDYILWNIVKYSDIVVLEKHSQRYSILKIEYESGNSEYDFELLFNNMFGTSDEEIEKSISLLTEDNQSRFRNRVETERNKFLFLMGKLKLKPRKCNRIANVILNFVNNDVANLKRSRANKKYIYTFFILQAQFISKVNISKFIVSVYEIDNMYDSNYLSQLLRSCDKNGISIKIDKRDFENYILRRLKTDLIDKDRIVETETFIEIYPFLNSKQQDIIKGVYLGRLESNFNFGLYYLLTIYGLIPFDYKNHLWHYIDKIDISKFVNNDFHSMFNLSRVKKYSEVDKILNILFMNNVELSQPQIQRFSAISNYYSWILNLDNYNYNDFDPYWIDEYNTTYYFEHFKRSEKLRDYLKKYLENEIDRRIEKLYDSIYCDS